MDTQVKTEEDVQRHKPIMFLGKDLLEIKCFRNSFIFGICTGVVGGLGTFLFTSKTLFSTHMSFASLWVGVFGYWYVFSCVINMIPCRYKYESALRVVEEMKKRDEERFYNEMNDSKSEE